MACLPKGTSLGARLAKARFTAVARAKIVERGNIVYKGIQLSVENL